VQTLRAENVTDYFEAYGNVHARKSSVLSAKLPGYVRSVNVREGQQVRTGQILVEIDSPELRSQSQRAEAGAAEAQDARAEVAFSLQAAEAALKAAEAQFKLAQETHSRFQALLAKESVSRQEFDEAEARYLSTRAQLEQARQQRSAVASRKQQVEAKIQQAQSEVATANSYLSYLSLTAPYSGTVVRRHVDPGTLAVPGIPLITIEDTAELQLEVQVPESLRWKILPSQPVLAGVETAGIKDQAVIPNEIVNTADPATRSFTFKLALPKKDELRSGMYGRALFPIGSRSALQIPAGSLVRRGQLDGVFVCTPDNRAEWRLVKPGQASEGRMEILAGLKEGERIVIAPPPALTAGDRIEVKP
jgi:multidrug efflux pump subunit AcrA (membrane-fusion protein)